MGLEKGVETEGVHILQEMKKSKVWRSQKVKKRCCEVSRGKVLKDTGDCDGEWTMRTLLPGNGELV